jgi:hypothetical protein
MTGHPQDNSPQVVQVVIGVLQQDSSLQVVREVTEVELNLPPVSNLPEEEVIKEVIPFQPVSNRPVEQVATEVVLNLQQVSSLPEEQGEVKAVDRHQDSSLQTM